MEDLHIGEKIKKVLEFKGITVTEFAKRINKSRENIYSIFTRKTIDTGLLQSISNVLEYDFFMHLSTAYYTLEEEIQLLKEENKLLKDYNKLLKKAKKWIYSLGAVPECPKDVSKGRTKHNKIFDPAGVAR